MSSGKKVFVLTRYSILSKDAARSWKIGQQTEEEYRNTLFKKERLELHKKLFELLTFPSLVNAVEKTNLDIRYLIFISTELPSHYKEAVFEIVSDFSFVSVVEVSPNESTIPFIQHEVHKELAGEEEGVAYATVRLDDDDALHPNFFRELEGYVSNAYAGMGVSFSKGYSGIYDGERFLSFHEMHSINNAQGQILVENYSKLKAGRTIYGLKVAHSRLHWALPVIVDGSKSMYIRTVHEHGDFYSKDYEERMRAPNCADSDFVLSFFGLNPDNLM